ncbi:MAG: DNA circularization N-terminal domain-containing protein, partial [Bacteroidales bacterium]
MQPFTAKLDTWDLNILDISDALSHSIIRHEYINTDGADLEAMGAHARTVIFRSYWFGANGDPASPSYLNHFVFVDFLSKGSNYHTLVHPKYGTLKGYVENFNIHHDDTQDYCEIDIVFTESNIYNQVISPFKNAPDLTAAYAAQMNETKANMSNYLKNNGYSTLLNKTFSSLQSLEKQVTNVSVATKKFVASIDDNLKLVNSYLSSVTSISNSINNVITFTGDIPSIILSSIFQADNRLVNTLVNLRNLPVQFASNFVQGINNFKFLGPSESLFTIALKHSSSGNLIFESNNNLVADQLLVSQQNTQPAFDINGNSNITNIKPIVMSKTDIESMMVTIQEYTQDAIIANRECPSLKLMMATLNSYVNFIKLSRLSVKEINVNNIPLHML